LTPGGKHEQITSANRLTCPLDEQAARGSEYSAIIGRSASPQAAEPLPMALCRHLLQNSLPPASIVHSSQSHAPHSQQVLTPTLVGWFIHCIAITPFHLCASIYANGKGMFIAD